MASLRFGRPHRLLLRPDAKEMACPADVQFPIGDGRRGVHRFFQLVLGEEVELFLRSIREGLPSPIPLDSLWQTTTATFRIVDSVRTSLPQSVEERSLDDLDS